MLQHRNPVQDENSGVAALKLPPDADNTDSGVRMPGKVFAAGGNTPGLCRRKALGNITNTEWNAADTVFPLRPRRALGDITNATPVQPSHAKPKQPRADVQKPVLPQALARQVECLSGNLYSQLVTCAIHLRQFWASICISLP